MNRPSLFTVLLGNWLSVGGVLSFTGLACYRWATRNAHQDTISWVVPAAGLLLSKASVLARGRMNEHRRWSRAWSEMAGGSAARRGARWGRRLLCWAAWVGLGAWLTNHQYVAATPVHRVFGVTFAALTLWGVSVPVVGSVRWLRRRVAIRPSRQAREDVVTICLPVPRTSPKASLSVSALPHYCVPLLRSSSETVAS